MVPWLLIGASAVALLAASRMRRPLPPELAYLTVTSTGLDNTPPAEVWPALRLLSRFVEGLRRRYGTIRVQSAYRSPAVNAAVGGVPTSLHLQGRALDWSIPGDDQQLADLFRSWVAEPYRIVGLVEEAQLHQVEGRPAWLHVGLARKGLAPQPRLKTIRRSGGRTTREG